LVDAIHRSAINDQPAQIHRQICVRDGGYECFGKAARRQANLGTVTPVTDGAGGLQILPAFHNTNYLQQLGTTCTLEPE